MLDFLGSQASVKILELFCKNPEQEFYSKEVQKKLDLSKATTIKWLKRLSKRGLLNESSSGRRKYYNLCWGNPLARQVRVLFTLSELIPALKEVSDIRSAYLVGPAARGTDPPNSPIDLLILKRGGSRRIQETLTHLSSKIGREIEAKIMFPVEYADLARDNPKLHERLEREKIRLPLS